MSNKEKSINQINNTNSTTKSSLIKSTKKKENKQSLEKLNVKKINQPRSNKQKSGSKNNQKDKNKIDYKDLTITQIEQELKRETYRTKYLKVLMSTIYALIIVAASAALIATLVMPVLQISGSSMTPTFHEGEIVISVKTKELKAGDIIAFYHGNKILVKRVIAGAGNWINITEDGSVYINGEQLNEPYIEEFSLGDPNIGFPYQVPDGHWFVLGDHREISIDSRNSEIGSISQENIVGKIVFRVWPLKKIGKIQ